MKKSMYVRLNPNYPEQPQKWLIIDRGTDEYVDYEETREKARERANYLCGAVNINWPD